MNLLPTPNASEGVFFINNLPETHTLYFSSLYNLGVIPATASRQITLNKPVLETLRTISNGFVRAIIWSDACIFEAGEAFALRLRKEGAEVFETVAVRNHNSGNRIKTYMCVVP